MSDRRVTTEQWILGSGGPAAGCASVALIRRATVSVDMSSISEVRHEIRLTIWEPGTKEPQLINLNINSASGLGDALIRAAEIARSEQGAASDD